MEPSVSGTKQNQAPGDESTYAVFKRVIAENGREYVRSYAVAILCLVLIAGSTAYLPWVMGDIIDEIFYRQRTDLIALICASVLIAFVVRGVATYLQAVILARIGNDIVARYQNRVFAKLVTLGLDFFTEARSGRLAAQINQNINGVRTVMSATITSLARDFVTLIALVGVMVTKDWFLSLVAALIGPPLILSVVYVSRRVRKVVRETVILNSTVIGTMQEVSQGIAVVKAFTMEQQLARRLEDMVTKAQERADKLASVSERITPLAEILAGLAVSGVIAYSGYRTVVEGELPGSMFAFITALLLAYEPAKRLARLQVTLERATVNARMIYEIIDLESPQRDVPGAKSLDVDGGNIAFSDVDFAYDAGFPVLRSLSFSADAGKTTAIVGASGAGKSTVISLLLRFYDVPAGTITIDGQDISQVTKASLRGAMAYVSQQPYLFEGTIRDNIGYGRPEATDAEIEDAARLANAEEFILTQPQGYETPIGENGVTLSGGQRQRLSIARAIVRNAPILLLDEATSALDNESEKLVQDALDRVMKGRTTIVIAHRLSTVVSADKIIVMDSGQVVEQGTHRELVDRPGGVYARFHALQSGGTPDLLGGGAAVAEPEETQKTGTRTS